MKRKILSFVTSVMVAFTVLILPLSSNAANYGSDDLKNYAYQVAAIVNRERATNGLEPLKFSDKLSEAAIVRAKEIQTYFSHTRPDGRSCFTAVTDMGIRYRTVGENIAYGQRDPEEVMKGWMNSAGHRANILSKNYDYVGIGVAYKNGVYYWTQFFARSDDLTGYAIPEKGQDQKPTATASATTTTTRITTAATKPSAATVTTTTTVAAANDPDNFKYDKYEILKMLLKRFGIELSKIYK